MNGQYYAHFTASDWGIEKLCAVAKDTELVSRKQYYY